MIWGIDYEMGITDQTAFAPMLSVFFPIEWIVIPVSVVEGKDSLDACLDNRTATGKTRKLGDVDRRPLYCDAHASRVDDRILFGVANDLYFFVSIIEDLAIVINSSRKAIEACSQDDFVGGNDHGADLTIWVF